MKQQSLNNNFIKYRAPSNIAFVKYWGKRDRQVPMNPSLSMTLDHCYTETQVGFNPKKSSDIISSFLFENKENESFKKRVEHYLFSIQDKLPWLSDYQLNIETQNSFPHSSGIASSASSFAALASCLADFDAQINKREFSYSLASELARLGSGSASRSIQGPFMLWGEDKHTPDSNNDYAIKFNKFSENFSSLKDSILIVSSKSKEVGSSVGHGLMHGHLYKEVRYQQARDNYQDIIQALKEGDFNNFGAILESEALTLHALMMTSNPSFILLTPNSLAIIQRVRDFRKEFDIPLFFTIDAGPNIHLIYSDKDEQKVLDFISNELVKYCENGRIIHDNIGSGIKKVNS